MSAVIALAKKDLKLLFRDKTGFAFTFIFPLIYAVFFGTIFSGSSGEQAGMRIVVVDEDNSEQSRAFLKELGAAAELSLTTADRTEAARRVRIGDCTGYVVMTKGFGQARERMFWGDPMRIEIGVDPARKAEAGMLQGIITKYAMEGFQKAFADPALMRKQTQTAMADLTKTESEDSAKRAVFQRFFGELDEFMAKLPGLQTDETTKDGKEAKAGPGWQPVAIETVSVARTRQGPENSYEVSFPQAIMWGVLGCAAAFGMSIVTERTHGTLVRLRMSPLGQGQILAGKATACFITIVTMVCGLLAIGVVLFKVRPASIPLLAMAVVSVALCFVGIMMLLSVIGRTERSVAGIGWAVMVVMAMLGGGMIPLFIMPGWMQRVSDVSPVKWAILSMEGAIWRAFSPAEMLLPCGVLVSVGVIAFIVGTKAFRWGGP